MNVPCLVNRHEAAGFDDWLDYATSRADLVFGFYDIDDLQAACWRDEGHAGEHEFERADDVVLVFK